MPTCASCFNGACPEVVPVTNNAYSYTVNGAAVTITVTAISVTEKSIAIQADVAGFYMYDYWFVNNSAVPGTVTANPPDTKPGVASGSISSDAAGLATLVVEHTGGLANWYLVIKLFGALKISEALTFGV